MKLSVRYADDEVVDFDIVDCSPNHRRRSWIISFEKGRPPYGVLQRSDTNESSFDFDVALPRKMVARIIDEVTPQIVKLEALRHVVAFAKGAK